MGYVAYMKEKGLNDKTINTRLRACRAFVNFLISNSYIKLFKVKLVREKNYNDKIPYTDDELKLLIKPPKLSRSLSQRFCKI